VNKTLVLEILAASMFNIYSVTPEYCVSKGTIESECTIKEMKICVAFETKTIVIKYTKWVTCDIKNTTCFTSYKCPLSLKVAVAPPLNPVHFILSTTEGCHCVFILCMSFV
jgi:hypothetical protein